ncbi:hypothetical protein C8R46DRAFT_1060080 [Mycena filopes]|nr:hypothetical protein C8R46DRAFT_1060080 [Mycena filopes]
MESRLPLGLVTERSASGIWTLICHWVTVLPPVCQMLLRTPLCMRCQWCRPFPPPFQMMAGYSIHSLTDSFGFLLGYALVSVGPPITWLSLLKE